MLYEIFYKKQTVLYNKQVDWEVLARESGNALRLTDRELK